MVYGRVEGFDGSMDSHLDADKDTDSEGNPHHCEECPHLIQTKMSEGNLFEKVIKGHECELKSEYLYTATLIIAKAVIPAPHQVRGKLQRESRKTLDSGSSPGMTNRIRLMSSCINPRS